MPQGNTIGGRIGPLTGSLRLPADPAVATIALTLAGVASGTSCLDGMPDSALVRDVAGAAETVGASISRVGAVWRVNGTGNGCLLQPHRGLRFTTSAAFLTIAGLLAPYDIETRLEFPGGRAPQALPELLAALRRMGVQVAGSIDPHAALTLRGPRSAAPFEWTIRRPSPVLKTALLLASLNAAGTSAIVESSQTADHVERLLAGHGAQLDVRAAANGSVQISIGGQRDLRPRDMMLPGDPALAALAVVAALIVPDSDVVVENVLMNPLRAGFVPILQEMGGDIAVLNWRDAGGEDAADLHVRFSDLSGMTIPADVATGLSEHRAAIAVAAAFAEGETVLGAGVAPSADAAMLAAALGSSGVECREAAGALSISGRMKGRGMHHPGVLPAPDTPIGRAMLVLAAGLQAHGIAGGDDHTPLRDIFAAPDPEAF